MWNKKVGDKAGKDKGLFASFSLRMSLYILLITTSIFVVTLVLTYRTASSQVRSEVVDYAQVALDNTIFQISTILQDVESVVTNAAVMVEDNVSDPDAMYEITALLLENNPDIVGSAIAFVPDFYRQKGFYYAPYSYRNGDVICSKQLGSEDYHYHEMEWYKVSMSKGKPHWSEPYYDSGGADAVLVTYSFPLRDADSNMYAVFTADISIEQFAEQVKTIKPYPDAYNFMLSHRGAFLAHSRHEALLTETVFDNAKRFNEPQLAELANTMLKQERGVCVYQRDNIDYYVLYAPVYSTGWSVAVACPYTNIFSGVYDLRDAIILIFSIGIVFIVGLCYFVIRRLTLPLKKLTLSAGEIATGNFELHVPEVKGKDEMRQLRDSFENMRLSLIKYIDELRATTAQKERMASDLRVARDIQIGMLPKNDALVAYSEKIRVYARLIAAKEVGGDLYNFFVKDGKLYFIVGDVSGKGVPASLVMAMMCRMFRTVASVTSSPAEILSMLNKVLAENNDSNMFCTAFVGILDVENGTLAYANAGHNPPIVLNQNCEPYCLDVSPEIPLGVIDEYVYTDTECNLQRGAHLLVYTDGVTEAADNKGLLFGEERLQKFLSQHLSHQPQEIVDALIEELANFSDGCEQSDDIAILDIKLMNDDE